MHRDERRTVRTRDGLTIGVKRRPLFLDIYHLFLGTSWPQALGAIVGGFLTLNLLFSIFYFTLGGVTGVRNWLDAFALSVQAMATIGYGGMSPETPAAHVLVIVEAVFGLLFTALTTGLVFAKFTLAPVSVVFARYAVIHPMNGQPTLALRLGNERGNLIVDAHVRLVMMRTETTAEGVAWYRMLDLPLQRSWMPAVTRGWSILHTIDAESPLHGATPESLKALEVELILTLAGMDQTTLQATHALKRYEDQQILFGQRHTDMTSVAPDGTFVMDVSKFDELAPAPLT